MFARHLVVFRWLGLAAAMSTFAFRAVEAETEAIPAGPSLEAAFATDSPGSGSVTAPKASDARPTEPPANPAVPEAPPAGAADPSTSQNDPPATTTDVPESTPAFRIISEPAEELAEPETAEPANPAIPEVSERGLMELPSDGAAALEPVPDPIEHKTPVIEAASFKGVTPGISTLEEVQKAWGAPQDRGNGVLFKNYDAGGLWWALERTVENHRFFRAHPRIWQRQLRRIMIRAREEWSLEKMVAGYITLYEELNGGKPLI